MITFKIFKNVFTIKRKTVNNFFLSFFFIFCLATFILKIIDGILLDLGFRDGQIHPNFWEAPFRNGWIDSSWSTNDKRYISAIIAIRQHPNTLWMITQFTWITTFFITLFIGIKLFSFKRNTPKWLKWFFTQKTLSWMSSFDFIVCLFFWIATINNGFENSLYTDLKWLEIMSTIFVHALIPIMIIIYSIVYLIANKKANLLKGDFFVKGIIYIFLYIIFYLILTLVWYDPYPVSNMHEKFIENGFDGWAKELWKVPIAFILISIILGIIFTFHNFIFKRFNKFYIKNNVLFNNKK